MAHIFVNPNSTESMTDAIVTTARIAAPYTDIEGRTSVEGPPAIQGAEDGAAATKPLLPLLQQLSDQGADSLVISCFDDTGLAEAYRIGGCPVIGIGQAAFHYAALRQWRFSVVTTLSVSVPVIERNIARYGLAHFCRSVRAAEVPVLALEADPKGAGQYIAEEARNAVERDGIDCVILGCAGMVAVTEQVKAALACPVIEPVETAARCLGFVADTSSTRLELPIGRNMA